MVVMSVDVYLTTMMGICNLFTHGMSVVRRQSLPIGPFFPWNILIYHDTLVTHM